jgi:hypothetical protein
MPALPRRPGRRARRDGPDPARLAHLYLCRGLSTYAIGEITGLAVRQVRGEWSASRGRGGVHRRADLTTGNYSTAPLPRRRAGKQPAQGNHFQERTTTLEMASTGGQSAAFGVSVNADESGDLRAG